VSVADARDNRYVLINRHTGDWCVSNLHGLQAVSEHLEHKQILPASLARVVFGEMSAPPTRSEPEPLFVIYKLTDSCNYNCTYCYDKAFARPKRPPTRNRTVRMVLKSTLEAGRRVNLLFHGGEPLIEFPEIVELVSDFAGYNRAQLQFSLQTNASLLTQNAVNFLLDNQIGLSVSVDGNTSAQNGLRIFRSNEDAYGVLQTKISHLSGLDPGRIGLLVTIGDHNASAAVEALAGFQRDGFRSVSFSLMQQVSNSAQPATPSGLVELFVRVVKEIVSGNIADLAVWTVIEWVRKLIFGASPFVCMGSPCGAGRSLITIYPSGEVGPCDSLFDAELIFSNVEAYLAGEKTSRLQTLLQRNTKTMEPCKSCDVAPLCNGTCPGNAILENGSLQAPASLDCQFHYMWIRELMWLLSSEHISTALLQYCRRHLTARQQMELVA
jgi:uncharacterized protein